MLLLASMSGADVLGLIVSALVCIYLCDPFCGSGSAAVAAVLQGCSFVGADVSPVAVDLARSRVHRLRWTGVDELEVRAAG